jgi:hypothetical protein
MGCSPDDEVDALAISPDGSRLIAAGAFTKIAGGRRDLAEFDLRNGFLTDWRPTADFYAGALDFNADGSLLFVGGEGELAIFR